MTKSMEKQVYEFIADQTGEKIVERKTCQCGEEFAITDKDMEFYDKISPVFDGKKYSIPAPTLCPDCRQQRRLAWRNERKLYKRKCGLSGKSIISVISPDKEYKVYAEKERATDKWEPKDYGKNFDFTRPFFEQLNDLLKILPYPATETTLPENSDYTNQTGWVKDCYLIFEAGFDENCYYGNNIWNSKNCVDNFKLNNCQICYECVDALSCYKLSFSFKCVNCSDSQFLNNCEGCNNCFVCVGLRNKQYYILNKQYTKEQYFQEIEKFLNNNLDYLKKELEKLSKLYPVESLNNISSEKSIGNNIISSKNVIQSFDIKDSEDIKYSYGIYGTRESMDFCAWGHECEHVYNCITVGNTVYNILFGLSNYDNISNLIYCMFCRQGIQNCFGCIGLHNNEKYCILNKQYTKEQYEELVPKIIEHMKSTGERGEFFPHSISLFGYNETVANEYFPLEKDEVMKQGFKRQDKEYPINVPEGTETINAKDLPEDINDVSDEILKKAVICEVSGKPFRIVKPELEFYRKHNLSLPHKHPDIRHLERLSKRAPRKLYLRTCDNCGKQVISVYPQNSEFKVYCEDCYNKEIY